MRKLILLAATALTLSATAAGAQDLSATAAQLRDKALTDPTAWNVTEQLTTDIGSRMVGSEGMTRAKDWAVATFKRMGFENVRSRVSRRLPGRAALKAPRWSAPRRTSFTSWAWAGRLQPQPAA